MVVQYPELMVEWNWEGNQDMNAYSIARYSNKKVSCICTEYGQWDASPSNRVKQGRVCPKCTKQHRVERCPLRGLLKDEFPEVCAELHPKKNMGIEIERLTSCRPRKVWWLFQSIHRRP